MPSRDHDRGRNREHDISRRDVLKLSAGGAGLAAACAALPKGLAPGPFAALAAPARLPRKLVVVLNSGGWDTTYALDPKPGASAIDVPEGALVEIAGIPLWSDPTRPGVDAFFERHAERCAVINGVQVRSFVHPDCLKRILTGTPSETAPDFLAVSAFEHGSELPVPYLALGGQARSGPYAAITGRTGTSNQLAALVDPAHAYPGPSGAGLLPNVGFVPSDEEQRMTRAYLDASARRLQATRGQRGYNRKRVDDFTASLDRAARLRRFATDSGVGDRDYTLALDVQIPLCVRALREGLSHAVLLETKDWDTHRGNARQGMLHEGLFGALGTLVDALEADSLLEQTVVVVLSEMGRTPRLNADEGKDHWPVTSAMVLGAGVRGGRVLGGTSETLDALSVDFGSGLPDASGKQLQAGNLVAGLLECVGVDPAQHVPGAEPFRAFMA